MRWETQSVIREMAARGTLGALGRSLILEVDIIQGTLPYDIYPEDIFMVGPMRYCHVPISYFFFCNVPPVFPPGTGRFGT